MRQNLVNLNVNPCKMCMPMGSASAFKGIARCMTILHGSQGCSTYIRRHMATHYNEPVDIASSSLTEQGTVFGGEKNLIKGLENLISLYNPDVIGVATTCLAETIGEDVARMVRDFYITHPDCSAKIYTVASSGYSGTQFEGFFAALYAIVTQTEMEQTPNDYINIVTGMISPADMRWLKQLVAAMGLKAIFLPDGSENLDGGYQPDYDRLPQGGTTLAQIRQMAGARMTIELSTFTNLEVSPAKALYERYGVPYRRLAMPVGLENTDRLLETLVALGGSITLELEKERARYLDAMVDSHKYNGQGRAVVYGEPDFVYAVDKLCLENGIVPVVTATGAKCEPLRQALAPEIEQLAELAFVEKTLIADDVDFDSIQTWSVDFGANVMIGNSDGRRVAHKLGLPLVRCAFPIHDQVGGQRIRMLGYEGSLTLLDQVTNVLLLKVETGFRGEMYEKYFQNPVNLPTSAAKPLAGSLQQKKGEPQQHVETTSTALTAQQRTQSHPCFNGCGGKYARIHLPVAPACNIQCNYCVRKYDCPNESRPGVTTAVLNPAEAAARYLQTKQRMENLTVVGIAGPGDALANFENTKETLSLIRAQDKDVTICLSTNGLMLPQYADELEKLTVSHITVTVNAVDPQIGAKIYHHVTYMGTTYTGVEAASILLSNQLAGIRMMAQRGAVVKVNIVMIPGINDHHIPKVVETVKRLGATLTNIMQLIPVEGSAFEHIPLVSHQQITQMRKSCGEILTQMYHCRQCRADAVGTLQADVDTQSECGGCVRPEKPAVIAAPKPAPETLPVLFAVSTRSGQLVDQHFGHTTGFYIYELRGKEIAFKEQRTIQQYCNGGGACEPQGQKSAAGSLDRILDTVKDCSCIVTMRIGQSPRSKLEENGKRIHVGFGPIEQVVREAAQAI